MYLLFTSSTLDSADQFRHEFPFVRRTKRHAPVYKGGTLRIGAFGATRPQKNLMSAAGAALQLHEELKVETEFWVSRGRLEGGGNTILNSVRAMCVRVPGFTLKELGWATWPQFRDVLAAMKAVP